MQSLWSDREAAEFVDRYAAEHGEDVALRIYSSRLIGREAGLVLHGGGNTSVKTRTRDLLGEEIEVIRVKGSGASLAEIEPAGLPELELAPLLRLEALEALGDDQMWNQLRIHLLDASAPTPSVEALLHAFLPPRFVDHTHADAFLVLGNQPDGAALVREALGERVAVLPWIMPGFPLARAVARAFREQPDCEGVALLHHGLLTFDDEARASYERMIELVDRAERWLHRRTGGTIPLLSTAGDRAPGPPGPTQAQAERDAGRLAPVVRGALALRDETGREVDTRFVMEWRGPGDLLALSSRPELRHLLASGPLTPDHCIRTKNLYLGLSREQSDDPEVCRRAVSDYARAYRAYCATHHARVPGNPALADPHPRVVVIEGVGILAFGPDKRAARVAADIAEQTLRAKATGEAIGRYRSLDPGQLFEMEYWPLQRAKLPPRDPAPLASQVALITGAAGAIGHGIAEALLAAGAHVMLTDLDGDGLERARGLLAGRHPPGRIEARRMDVTDASGVEAAFLECCLRFGGVDVVVPNAGIAHVSPLKEMDPERFRTVVEVNLTGTMNVLRAAARILERQGTGGAVVIQASKNVFDPGAGFGAYSASKAGAHQLGKIAALELAPLGVRVNMINADAVFGDAVPSGLWAEVGPDRMRARGLDPQGLREYYRERSLLKLPVSPAHVGEAVVLLASGLRRTTGATLPVDGGVPGAFPR